MNETGRERLRRLAASDPAKQVVAIETVRTLLSWFDAKRRGVLVVEALRDALEVAGLTTEPDFEGAYIDSHIELKRVPKSTPDGAESAGAANPASEAGNGAATTETTSPSVPPPATSSSHLDPSFRLSKLEAANNIPTHVHPDVNLSVAVTTMLSRDYSQLPVMTNDRDVKGAISWRSIAARLATGHQGSKVRDFVDDVDVLESTASFFDAIRFIVAKQYVLVRGADRRIVGIVTASDVSVQFELLTEPFLLLSEIENDLRRVIQARFSVKELESCKAPNDTERTIDSVNDMTFGEYVRLLENPANWAKLNSHLDRSTFVASLKKVAEVRNDVMHFDPDGILPEDLDSLRAFAKFMRRLRDLGVT